MFEYLLANVILGVPAIVAAIVVSKRQQPKAKRQTLYNDCKWCGHLVKLNRDPTIYKYVCSECGHFDKQPKYCKKWIPRDEN